MAEYLESLRRVSARIERTTLIAPGAVRVRAEAPGPRAAIFGAIHGDEPCGAQAIVQILEALAEGRITLEQGSLTLALGNLDALDRQVRRLEFDLNRLFRDDLPADLPPEHVRASVLRPLLRETDWFLDLHATRGPSRPFIICERPMIPAACELGITPVITGWGDIDEPSLAGDAERYANVHGAKAFTLENGSRDWGGGADHAYRKALIFLQYARLLGGFRRPAEQVELFELFASYTMTEAGFRYARAFENLSPLAQHETIGWASHEVVRAQEPCFIVMPGIPFECRSGEDLFQMARKIKAVQ